MKIRALLPFVLALLLVRSVAAQHAGTLAAGHVLTARGERLYLDEREFLVRGLRTSNALISDEATGQLVAHRDTFAAYGVNTFTGYFMGSRFGDVKGFDPEGLIRAGKAVDAKYLIALNSRSGVPAPSADLHIVFAPPVAGKPHIESEGTVSAGAPGGYWGTDSKRPDVARVSARATPCGSHPRGCR